jgi:hypothetical protein
MDKKYKTYNWNIEMNLQEEALRYEAIRECLSDTLKEDTLHVLNASTSEDKQLQIGNGRNVIYSSH